MGRSFGHFIHTDLDRGSTFFFLDIQRMKTMMLVFLDFQQKVEFSFASNFDFFSK